MRRIVGIVAFLCTLSLLIIPVGATEFTPRYYYCGVYATGEQYTRTLDGVEQNILPFGSTTGTFTIPLNIDERFKTYYIGGMFNTTTYDVGAKYRFDITITFGATGSYSGSTTGPLSTTHNYVVNGSKFKWQPVGGTYVKTTGTLTRGESGTYTWSYTDITYEQLVGNDFFYIALPKSRITSMSTTDIYIVNSYFGLTSEYSEDNYKSQTLENLDQINNSLNDINNNINNTNNKLDQTNENLEGIQNSLDQQIDNEINRAETEGNETNQEAESSLNLLPDFSESYNSFINNLGASLYDMNVQTTFTLPNGTVNILGQEFDIWAGKETVDLTTFLEDNNMKILIIVSKGISVMSCMAVSIYWAYRIKEAITSTDEVELPEIPFLPGGGKY